MTHRERACVCSRRPAHQLSIINTVRARRRRGSGSLSRVMRVEWAQHGGNSRTYSGSCCLFVPLQFVIKFPRGVFLETLASDERPRNSGEDERRARR